MFHNIKFNNETDNTVIIL